MGREFAKVSVKPVAQGRGCQHNRPMPTLPMLNPTLQTVLLLTANRIGYQQAGLSAAQLKIVQEVLTLSVFVPFAVFYLREPLKLDYLWAALCMVGAVYFIFRSA